MQINILNWNVAGAKYLEESTRRKKTLFRNKLNQKFRELIDVHKPDVITLQEIVEYNKLGEPKEGLIKPVDGYTYCPHILINTIEHPYVSKWKKVETVGHWPKGSYFAQGNAILWREKLPHFAVWSLPKIDSKPDRESHVEKVILMSGLYFGDRNTEPRAALVAHFVIPEINNKAGKSKIPLDIFVVNIHLTTLMGEREGIPNIDEGGRRIRLEQLHIILDGIVSRYNDWRRNGYPFRGEKRIPSSDEDFDRCPPIWILCGDFNFVPESSEHAFLTSMNFIDVHSNKGKGTKGKGHGGKSQATITCDYIFAGPKFISLDPIFTKLVSLGNPPPFDDVKVSDHYPLFAEIPLSTPKLQDLKSAGF